MKMRQDEILESAVYSIEQPAVAARIRLKGYVKKTKLNTILNCTHK